MKQECNKCNESKDLSEFEHQNNRPNPRKTCKKCRQKNRVYTDEHRLKRRIYAFNQRQSEGYFENRKNNDLIRNYNIDLNIYNNMLKNQDNKCVICENEFKNSKNIHVDHNHTTGAVRDLLCSKCNTALGMFYENVKSLENAIKYLKKHN